MVNLKTKKNFQNKNFSIIISLKLIILRYFYSERS